MARKMSARLADADPARAAFMARVALVLSELGETCADLQDNLGSALSSGTLLSSAAAEQIQELDRVTQTIEALAALFSDLEHRLDQSGAGIAMAVERVQLQSVRDRLLGQARTVQSEAELF